MHYQLISWGAPTSRNNKNLPSIDRVLWRLYTVRSSDHRPFGSVAIYPLRNHGQALASADLVCFALRWVAGSRHVGVWLDADRVGGDCQCAWGHRGGCPCLSGDSSACCSARRKRALGSRRVLVQLFRPRCERRQRRWRTRRGESRSRSRMERRIRRFHHRLNPAV